MTGGAMGHESPGDELAAFVSALGYDDLPQPAVEVAERCFLDTAGVMLAGVTAGAGRLAVDLQTQGPTAGRARLVGVGDRVPVEAAAFTNATAGHVHDYDDYAQAIIAHPSVVLVPSILALGEADGLHGRDAIAAFVAGYETMVQLGATYIEPFYRAGWFSTTLFGTVGAAAAGAVLLDLDAERTRAALNIATAMASGTLQHNGTASKPLQVGQAARTGVSAARFAAAGASAADVLTGEGGFYDLHIDEPRPTLGPLDPPGEWTVLTEGIHRKKYPCCSDAHTAIAAAATLRDEIDTTLDAIESVTVRASGRARDVLRFDEPTDGTEAMFSMPYLVACMLVRGHVDIADFDDERVNDPAVQTVRETVDFERDPALSYQNLEATVAVVTADGPVERTVTTPPGHTDNPLSEAELQEKFVTCAGYSLGESPTEVAYDRLRALRSTRIGPVMDALTGSG